MPSQNFTPFYSKYYDLFYADKNYQSEFGYVSELIKEHSAKLQAKKIKSMLDIGCGTGKHLACFQAEGYEIAGVDMSESQIEQAKSLLGANTDLQIAKASEFSFNKKFDFIVSLFHVMSYQTSNEELQAVFANVAKHLNSGGLFAFDFWHGAGVLTDLPQTRIKRLGNITRFCEPVMRYEENVVEVNYEIIGLPSNAENQNSHLTPYSSKSASEDGSANKDAMHFTEQHRMRYFFEQELKMFAEISGLKPIAFHKWLTKENLGNAWYGVAVMRKET